jgi:hypothetical protein
MMAEIFEIELEQAILQAERFGALHAKEVMCWGVSPLSSTSADRGFTGYPVKGAKRYPGQTIVIITTTAKESSFSHHIIERSSRG